MKKQLIILLAVVSTLMAALFLASCSQPAASSGAASASAEAEASASTSPEAEASTSAEAEASAEASADAGAVTAPAEYKGIPTSIPASHEGRTVDMCPTCHLNGTDGATQIPDDHLVNGELDGARNQCNTCHLEESA